MKPVTNPALLSLLEKEEPPRNRGFIPVTDPTLLSKLENPGVWGPDEEQDEPVKVVPDDVKPHANYEKLAKKLQDWNVFGSATAALEGAWNKDISFNDDGSVNAPVMSKDYGEGFFPAIGTAVMGALTTVTQKFGSRTSTPEVQNAFKQFMEENNVSKEDAITAWRDLGTLHRTWEDGEDIRTLSDGTLVPNLASSTFLDKNKALAAINNSNASPAWKMSYRSNIDRITEEIAQSKTDQYEAAANAISKGSFIQGPVVATYDAIAGKNMLSPSAWALENDRLGDMGTPDFVLDYEADVIDSVSGLRKAAWGYKAAATKGAIKLTNTVLGLGGLMGVDAMGRAGAMLTNEVSDITGGAPDAGFVGALIEETPSLGAQILVTSKISAATRAIGAAMGLDKTHRAVTAATAFGASVVAGGQSGGLTFSDQIAQGATEEEARQKSIRAGINTAVIVGVFQAAGMGGVEDVARGKALSDVTLRDLFRHSGEKRLREKVREFATSTLKAATGEASEEGIDELSQSFLTADPDTSLATAWENAEHAAAIGGFIGGAVHIGANEINGVPTLSNKPPTLPITPGKLASQGLDQTASQLNTPVMPTNLPAEGAMEELKGSRDIEQASSTVKISDMDIPVAEASGKGLAASIFGPPPKGMQYPDHLEEGQFDLIPITEKPGFFAVAYDHSQKGDKMVTDTVYGPDESGDMVFASDSEATTPLAKLRGQTKPFKTKPFEKAPVETTLTEEPGLKDATKPVQIPTRKQTSVEATQGASVVTETGAEYTPGTTKSGEPLKIWTKTKGGRSVGDKYDPGMPELPISNADSSSISTPSEYKVKEISNIISGDKNEVDITTRDMTPDEMAEKKSRLEKENELRRENGIAEIAVPEIPQSNEQDTKGPSRQEAPQEASPTKETQKEGSQAPPAVGGEDGGAQVASIESSITSDTTAITTELNSISKNKESSFTYPNDIAKSPDRAKTLIARALTGDEDAAFGIDSLETPEAREALDVVVRELEGSTDPAVAEAAKNYRDSGMLSSSGASVNPARNVASGSFELPSADMAKVVKKTREGNSVFEYVDSSKNKNTPTIRMEMRVGSVFSERKADGTLGEQRVVTFVETLPNGDVRHTLKKITASDRARRLTPPKGAPRKFQKQVRAVMKQVLIQGGVPASRKNMEIVARAAIASITSPTFAAENVVVTDEGSDPMTWQKLKGRSTIFINPRVLLDMAKRAAEGTPNDNPVAMAFAASDFANQLRQIGLEEVLHYVTDSAVPQGEMIAMMSRIVKNAGSNLATMQFLGDAMRWRLSSTQYLGEGRLSNISNEQALDLLSGKQISHDGETWKFKTNEIRDALYAAGHEGVANLVSLIRTGSNVAEVRAAAGRWADLMAGVGTNPDGRPIPAPATTSQTLRARVVEIANRIAEALSRFFKAHELTNNLPPQLRDMALKVSWLMDEKGFAPPDPMNVVGEAFSRSRDTTSRLQPQFNRAVIDAQEKLKQIYNNFNAEEENPKRIVAINPTNGNLFAHPDLDEVTAWEVEPLLDVLNSGQRPDITIEAARMASRMRLVLGHLNPGPGFDFSEDSGPKARNKARKNFEAMGRIRSPQTTPAVIRSIQARIEEAAGTDMPSILLALSAAAETAPSMPRVEMAPLMAQPAIAGLIPFRRAEAAVTRASEAYEASPTPETREALEKAEGEREALIDAESKRDTEVGQLIRDWMNERRIRIDRVIAEYENRRREAVQFTSMGQLLSEASLNPRGTEATIRRSSLAPSATRTWNEIRKAAETAEALRDLETMEAELDHFVLGTRRPAHMRPNTPRGWRNVNALLVDVPLELGASNWSFLRGGELIPDNRAITHTTDSGTLQIEFGSPVQTDPKLRAQEIGRMIVTGSRDASRTLGFEPLFTVTDPSGRKLDSEAKSEREKQNLWDITKPLIDNVFEAWKRGDRAVDEQTLSTGGFPVDLVKREGFDELVISVAEDIIPIPDYHESNAEDWNDKMEQMVKDGDVGELLLSIRAFMDRMENPNPSEHTQALSRSDLGLTPAGMAYSLMAPKFLEFIALTRGTRERGRQAQKFSFEKAMLDAFPEKSPEREALQAAFDSVPEEIYTTPAFEVERKAIAGNSGELVKRFWELHRLSKSVNTQYRRTLSRLRQRNLDKREKNDPWTDNRFPVSVKALSLLAFKIKEAQRIRKSYLKKAEDRTNSITSLLSTVSATRLRKDMLDAQGELQDLLFRGFNPKADNLLGEGYDPKASFADETRGEESRDRVRSKVKEETELEKARKTIRHAERARASALMGILGGDTQLVIETVNRPEFTTPRQDGSVEYHPSLLDNWILDELDRMAEEERSSSQVTDDMRQVYDGGLKALESAHPEHALTIRSLIDTGGTASKWQGPQELMDMDEERGFESSPESVLYSLVSRIPSLTLIEGNRDYRLIQDGAAASAPLRQRKFGKPLARLQADIDLLADERAALLSVPRPERDYESIDNLTDRLERAREKLTKAELSTMDISGESSAQGDFDGDTPGSGVIPTVAFIPGAQSPVLALPYGARNMKPKDVQKALEGVLLWLEANGGYDLGGAAVSVIRQISELDASKLKPAVRNLLRTELERRSDGRFETAEERAKERKTSFVNLAEWSKIETNTQRDAMLEANVSAWTDHIYAAVSKVVSRFNGSHLFRPKEASRRIDRMESGISSASAANIVATALADRDARKLLMMSMSSDPGMETPSDVETGTLGMLASSDLMPGFANRVANDIVANLTEGISLEDPASSEGSDVDSFDPQDMVEEAGAEMERKYEFGKRSPDVTAFGPAVDRQAEWTNNFLHNIARGIRFEGEAPQGLLPFEPERDSLTEMEARQAMSMLSKFSIRDALGVDDSRDVSLSDLVNAGKDVADKLRFTIKRLINSDASYPRSEDYLQNYGTFSFNDPIRYEGVNHDVYREARIKKGALLALQRAGEDFIMSEDEDGFEQAVVEADIDRLELSLAEAGFTREVDGKSLEQIAREEWQAEKARVEAEIAQITQASAIQETRVRNAQFVYDQVEAMEAELMEADKESFLRMMREGGIIDADSPGLEGVGKALAGFFEGKEAFASTMASDILQRYEDNRYTNTAILSPLFDRAWWTSDQATALMDLRLENIADLKRLHSNLRKDIEEMNSLEMMLDEDAERQEQGLALTQKYGGTEGEGSAQRTMLRRRMLALRQRIDEGRRSLRRTIEGTSEPTQELPSVFDDGSGKLFPQFGRLDDKYRQVLGEIAEAKARASGEILPPENTTGILSQVDDIMSGLMPRSLGKYIAHAEGDFLNAVGLMIRDLDKFRRGGDIKGLIKRASVLHALRDAEGNIQANRVNSLDLSMLAQDVRVRISDEARTRIHRVLASNRKSDLKEAEVAAILRSDLFDSGMEPAITLVKSELQNQMDRDQDQITRASEMAAMVERVAKQVDELEQLGSIESRKTVLRVIKDVQQGVVAAEEGSLKEAIRNRAQNLARVELRSNTIAAMTGVGFRMARLVGDPDQIEMVSRALRKYGMVWNQIYMGGRGEFDRFNGLLDADRNMEQTDIIMSLKSDLLSDRDTAYTVVDKNILVPRSAYNDAARSLESLASTKPSESAVFLKMAHLQWQEKGFYSEGETDKSWETAKADRIQVLLNLLEASKNPSPFKDDKEIRTYHQRGGVKKLDVDLVDLTSREMKQWVKSEVDRRSARLRYQAEIDFIQGKASPTSGGDIFIDDLRPTGARLSSAAPQLNDSSEKRANSIVAKVTHKLFKDSTVTETSAAKAQLEVVWTHVETLHRLLKHGRLKNVGKIETAPGKFTADMESRAKVALDRLDDGDLDALAELSQVFEISQAAVQADSASDAIAAGYVHGEALTGRWIKMLAHQPAKLRRLFARSQASYKAARWVFDTLNRGISSVGGKFGGRDGAVAQTEVVNKRFTDAIKELDKGKEVEQAAFGNMYVAVWTNVQAEANNSVGAEKVLRAFDTADDNLMRALRTRVRDYDAKGAKAILEATKSKLSDLKAFATEETYKIIEERVLLARIREMFEPALTAMANGEIDVGEMKRLLGEAIHQNPDGKGVNKARQYGDFIHSMFKEIRPALELALRMEGSKLPSSPTTIVPLRWQSFDRDLTEDREVPDTGNLLSISRSLALQGPTRTMDRSGIDLLSVNGLEAPRQILADTLYRINTAPAYRLARAYAGVSVDQNQGKSTTRVLSAVEGKEGALHHVATKLSDKKKVHAIQSATRTLALMLQEVVLNDLTNSAPRSRTMQAIHEAALIGSMQALISASQWWRQTVWGTFSDVVLRDGFMKNIGLLPMIVEYAGSSVLQRPMNAIRSKFGEGPVEGKSMREKADEFIHKHAIRVRLRGPNADDIYLSDLDKKKISPANRATGRITGKGRGAADIVKAPVAFVHDKSMKLGRSLLHLSIAKPEQFITHPIVLHRLLRGINSQLAEAGLDLITLDQMLDGEMEHLITPILESDASTAVDDIFGLSDSSYKAPLLQSQPTELLEAMRFFFTTFANHQLSTTGNTWAGWYKVRFGEDAETRAEGRRLIAASMTQNTMFVLFRYETMALMAVTVLAQALDWDDREKEEALGWFHGVSPGTPDAERRGKLMHYIALFLGGSTQPVGYSHMSSTFTESEFDSDIRRTILQVTKEILMQSPVAGAGILASTTLGAGVAETSIDRTVGALFPGQTKRFERAGVTIRDGVDGNPLERFIYNLTKFYINDVADMSTLTMGINAFLDPIAKLSNAENDLDFWNASAVIGGAAPFLPREAGREIERDAQEALDIREWSAQQEPDGRRR